MVKKLYVGGLSYSSTEQSVRDAFSQCGTVETVTIIMDKMSGRSKGFGFVEMSTEDEAQAAITTWDGKELDGRTIRVSEARPQEDRPPRTGGGGGFRGGNRGGFGGGNGGGASSRQSW